MSQDLFAAFADAPATSVPAGSANTAGSNTLIAGTVEDDDDFGDFEDAAAGLPQQSRASAVTAQPLVQDDKHKHAIAMTLTASTTHSSNTPTKPMPKKSALPFKTRDSTAPAEKSIIGRHPFADHMDVLFAADEADYDAGQDEWTDLATNPEAAMAYSKRVIQQQLDAEARALASKDLQIATALADAGSIDKVKDTNVLFDMDNVSDDGEDEENDDWGDFQESKSRQSRPTTSSISKSTPPSMDLLGLEDQPVLPPKHIPAPKVTASSVPIAEEQADDAWDDFESAHDQGVSAASVANPPQPPAKDIVLPSSPPTTIPPPSLLLAQINASLKITPSAATVAALLQCSWVLTHILAGRKLRWKRSPSLAASMRIGPAVAGGRSGMKLAGVDRAESAKEDREVAEVLTTWRARVGKLRTAVSTHASALPIQFSVRKLPDIHDPMPVKTLRAAEGGFVAPHECALCGLRREERVAKVDEHMQDSFGEWWLDNASMHTVCAVWWVENEVALRSR